MSDSDIARAPRSVPRPSGPRDDEWLHALIGDWQLLADLSFADLTLWVSEPTPSTAVGDGAGEIGGGPSTRLANQPDGSPERWVGAAQARPTTGMSLLAEDVVDVSPPKRLARVIDQCFRTGSILTVESSEQVVVDVVPVRSPSGIQAVMTRHTAPSSVRRRGRLESTYLGLAQHLLEMVAAGDFPDGGSGWAGRGGSPRVGDGVIALGADETVTYASPNAVSALRRLGVKDEPNGRRLTALIGPSGAAPVAGGEEAAMVLSGRAPWHCELRRKGSAVSFRAVPLTIHGQRRGAAILLRDVSELRRRERELLTKDATIREIHHRVKNNLQTVAALLRLQARRVGDEEAKQALADAGRRVAVIAAVHESLSAGFDDTVDFDVVAARGLNSGIEVGRRTDDVVTGELIGHFGIVSSEDATTLAMVMAELVQNAVEHGLRDRPGHVSVEARRSGNSLVVRVVDDGVGLPGTTLGHDASSDEHPSNAGGHATSSPGAVSGLGTQIVKTFVSDLHGDIAWHPRPGGGTVVEFTAQLRPTSKQGRFGHAGNSPGHEPA